MNILILTLKVRQIYDMFIEEIQTNGIYVVNITEFSGSIDIEGHFHSKLGELDIAIECQKLNPRKILQQFAIISALESDQQALNERMINKQMEIFTIDKEKIKAKMQRRSEEKQYCPLHLFDEHDVMDTIKHWLYHDVDYEKNLRETMQIFSKNSLSGKFISFTSTGNAKQIVRDELLMFMEEKTIDIMFDEFEKFKTEHPEEIRTKSAPEIAYIVYHFPFSNLLEKIKVDKINGNDLIARYKNADNFIKMATGWKKEEIYQIEAILFRNSSMTKQEIIRNLQETLNNRKTISDNAKEQILHNIQSSDVESIAMKIKTGRDITEFSDNMMELVNNLYELNEEYKQAHNSDAYVLDDYMDQIYSIIANVFIYKDLNNDRLSLDKKTMDLLQLFKS